MYFIYIIVFLLVAIFDIFNCYLLNDSSNFTNLDIPSEYAFCYWIDIDLCSVKCFSADAFLYGRAIEYKLEEAPHCDELGFTLQLSTPVFHNFIMTSNWFTGNVTVRELQIDCNLEVIQPYAFYSDAFQTITHLTLNQVGVRTLNTGIFNGLHSLRELNIISSLVHVIQTNLLAAVQNTLEKLVMTQPLRFRANLPNGLTGNVPLSKLREVNFNMNNFPNTITEHTFLGLVAVERLILSDAHIEVLGDYTFDAIANTIRSIDLRHNHLKHLPSEIFENILPNVNLIFQLDQNEWLCDCNLESMQYILNEYPQNFIGTARCLEPIFFRNEPIASIEFCLHPILRVTIAPPSTENTPTTEPSGLVGSKAHTEINNINNNNEAINNPNEICISHDKKIILIILAVVLSLFWICVGLLLSCMYIKRSPHILFTKPNISDKCNSSSG